jgi:hypothetical protein
MWDTCAIDLTVKLPRTVAQEVAEVQRTDPELLSRMLTYAVVRRRIFDRLVVAGLHGRPGVVKLDTARGTNLP